jgi:hypothetical protein
MRNQLVDVLSECWETSASCIHFIHPNTPDTPGLPSDQPLFSKENSIKKSIDDSQELEQFNAARYDGCARDFRTSAFIGDLKLAV